MTPPECRSWKVPGPRIGFRATTVGVSAAFWAAAALSGCRGEPESDGIPVAVTVAIAPTPPIVGPARLVITVRDSIGGPLEGAAVSVEGTMAHAGMVPVREGAEPAGDGRYVVPAFDFTMGGDWLLSTRVRLPDGREALRHQELRVVSGPPPGDRRP